MNVKELAILIVLRAAGDAMTPEPSLFIPANRESPTPITRTDLGQILQVLEGKQQVIGIPGDDYTKWKISARGLARLAETNL